MNAQEMFEELAGLVMDQKREKCKRYRRGRGEHRDITTALHLRYANEALRVAVIPDGPPAIPVVMALLEREAKEKPVLVGFTADAYLRPLHQGEPRPERGQFEREFNDGRSDVRETLIVTVLDVAANTFATANYPYTYDRKGQPVFTDVDPVDALPGGLVVDNIRAALHLPTPDSELEALRSAVETVKGE